MLLAFVGGGIASLIFGGIWFSARSSTRQLRDAQTATSGFFDVVIILSMAALPQMALVAVPWIYVTPGSIPEQLMVPVVMATCAMTVLWF